jgi:CRP-like cAMP-binding protein
LEKFRPGGLERPQHCLRGCLKPFRNPDSYRGVHFRITSVNPVPASPPSANRLLAALEPHDLERLRPHLEAVQLPTGTVLLRPHEPIAFVHFLEAGLSSDVAVTGHDRPVECGLAGYEGLVGLPILLGTDRGIHESVMQVGGHGHRIASAELRRAMEESPSLRRLLLNFAHVFTSLSAQTAACNARHSIERRLARWLLLAHDRMADDRVPLTHEYLALMLGVRRAGVTVALHELEGGKLVRAGRGLITITDRPGLEARSCGCYGIVVREAERVLGAAGSVRATA